MKLFEVWSYDTREQEKDSLATLIDTRVIEGEIVCFVRVSDVFLNGNLTTIGMMPFSYEAFNSSKRLLVERLNQREYLSLQQDFEEGYAEWVEAEGGVYDISIKEALSITDETVS